MTLGILKRFYFGMSKSRRFNLSWLQGCPLSGIETLVTRSDNINLLSIPFSSNNRGCPMILCVRIKKTMELVDALLQRIDNIINPRRVCRLAALRRRPRRVCRLAALRRRSRRIRDVIGVASGFRNRLASINHLIAEARCLDGRLRRPAAAHRHAHAGQPRQEQAAHIRRQRQPVVPRQPVLGNVPDIVGDACNINRALDPVPRRVGVLQRVVVNIGIPVEALRVARLRRRQIEAEKPPGRRIIVSAMILHQPAGVPPLPVQLRISAHGRCTPLSSQPLKGLPPQEP